MKAQFILFIIFSACAVCASDAVLWQKELSCDFNSSCRPGELMVDKINHQLVLIGTSDLPESKEVSCRVWKIDTNGTVINTQSLGQLSDYDSLMVGSFGIKATIKPVTNDIVRLKSDVINDISLSITDRDMQSRTVKLNVTTKNSENLLWHDMISFSDDAVLIVGKGGNDGVIMKTDLAGTMRWKKIFDHGQTEILSNIDSFSEGTGFYAVGLSVPTDGKMSFANAATVCLLSYDSAGNLKADDFFEGGVAPWPSSLPKIICLPCGIVIVIYDKSMNTASTDLYIKAYTPELEVLYESQILQTEEDGPPAHFDVCILAEDRFVLVGKINYWDLRIFEFEADGTLLQTLDLNREVGPGNVYVDYLAGKIFIATATKLKENEKDSKIKLIALKSYEKIEEN